MEEYKHFSHPHNLSFYQSLECAELTCTGCNYPCTDTPIFSCHPCKFYLHKQCFDATRTLIRPSHPDHPLHYLPKPPYDVSLTCGCDMCGIVCNPNDPLYHCDICGYDAHVECVNLPETVKRGDHAHALSLLHVNPHESFECDVCKGLIAKNHCMYFCNEGCDYGMHVTCVSASVNVPEKTTTNGIELQVEMFKIHSQMLVNQTMLNSMAASGLHHYHRDRYNGI